MKKTNFFNGFWKAVLSLAALVMAVAVFAGCENTTGGSSGLTLRGTVTITGDAQVGKTLTADITELKTSNGDDIGQYQYEWQKNNTGDEANWELIHDKADITGNKDNYTPEDKDIGYSIRVVVSVIGYGNTVASNETDPVTAAAGNNGITYTALADGTADAESSTAITFSFSAEVSGLEATHINITPTGNVTKGELTGSGTSWSLAITVNTAGDVTVKIEKDGIEGAEKSVTVHKAAAPALDLTPEVTFGQTSGSSDVSVGTPDGAEDDQVVSMTIDAPEKGVVYFTALKETTQTITAGGTDGAKVTVHTSGTVDGEPASAETAVIAVKTGDLPFDGGTGKFALTVSDSAELAPRTINVTLNMTANKTGAAVFKVTRPTGQDYHGNMGEAVLERQGGESSNFTGLEAAITWVENNAEADTEYLIRVEKDETNLPKLALCFNNAANVTLRLRGTGDQGEWRLRHNNTNDTTLNVKKINLDTAIPLIQIGGGTTQSRRTFILGRNITVAGFGTTTEGTYVNRSLLAVMPNAMLVLEPGSKITDWYGTFPSTWLGSPIYIKNGAPADRDPAKHGHLRIEGGSITNCSFKTEKTEGNTTSYSGLVYVSSRESRMAVGSLYKAASTEENPITFSGNSSNEMYIHPSSSTIAAGRYDLSQPGELSIPTE
jgi:hypothetical protein